MSVFVLLISLNIITLYIHFCFSNGKIQFLWLYVSQSIQLLSCVPLFVTPWTAACQASLSITNSQSLFKLMPIKLVMTSNHLILYRPLLLPPSIFPSIRVFSNESVLRIRGQTIGVSASASVLPMNIQDWFPLGWTGWISVQTKGLSRVFSNTTVQKHQFTREARSSANVKAAVMPSPSSVPSCSTGFYFSSIRFWLWFNSLSLPPGVHS